MNPVINLSLPRSIPNAPGLQPGDEGKVWEAERKAPAFRPGIERGLHINRHIKRNFISNAVKKIFFSLIFIILAGCSQPQYYHRSFLLMGTIVNIKLENSIMAGEAAEKSIAKMKELEIVFNRFDEASEVYRVNLNEKNKKIEISEDLSYLVNLSFYLNRISKGAFDITVAPLLKLWGLYEKRKEHLPTESEIRETLDIVGSEKLKLDEAAGTIEFQSTGMELDLSGVAKGYIVDEAGKILKKYGIKNAIIDAGGDVLCLGDKKNEPWSIGIKDPQNKKNIIAKIKIKDKALATSGGYENFIIIDNEKYPHIIDPRTGKPVRNNILSATVISNQCAIADGLATALFILKPEEGLKLIEELEDVDCVIISKENDKVRFSISSHIMNGIEIL